MAPLTKTGERGAGYRRLVPAQRVRERARRYDTAPAEASAPSGARSQESIDGPLQALTLAALDGVGDRGYRLAVDHFGTPEAALLAGKALKSIVPTARPRPSALHVAQARAHEMLQKARVRGIELVTYGAAGYPERLARLHDPPRALWLRGQASILERPVTCAVVGARRASAYGVRTARALGLALAGRGVVVVSGMAMGIDGEAHRGALTAGGPTIAVLGSGVDVPTPKSQSRLYRQICEHGLVVSEFPPGQGAAPHNFPRRNRIIAALSEALVVVEAAQKSGSLITVDHAVDVGVHVYAVPGPIESRRSAGSNALLADGAGVVTSAESFASLWADGEPSDDPGTPPLPATEGERQLWECLADGPMTVDGLVGALGWSAAHLLATLGEMEIQGWVEPAPGGRFARAPGRGQA